MTASEQSGEPYELDGGSLGCLRFRWESDRYFHQFDFSALAGNECVIQSVESDNEQAWPVSPPLQQIHQQSFADGRDVIFGIGMAGRGHWSASFTLVPELKSWIVELACRSSSRPEALSSTYDFQTAEHLVERSEETGDIVLAAGKSVRFEAVSPSSKGLYTNNQLAIQPATLEDQSETVQWAFRVRIA